MPLARSSARSLEFAVHAAIDSTGAEDHFNPQQSFGEERVEHQPDRIVARAQRELIGIQRRGVSSFRVAAGERIGQPHHHV